MSTIPDSPYAVRRKLSEIILWAENLMDAYESDFDVGYAVRGRSIQATDPDWRPSSGHSDPTGEAVATLEHQRRVVARMAARIGEAHVALDEATAATITPVPRSRRCRECRRGIHRPKGRSSGLCDSCDRKARRKAS